MKTIIAESEYPLTFRQEDSERLGEYLRHRHSVDIVGMKRVGISNFLRFFLNHEGIIPRFVSKTEKHLFIQVDLNDLVEKELYPFWVLTFKRIVDCIEQSSLSRKKKQYVSSIFLHSIQTQDLFLLIDAIRQSLQILVEHDFVPTLFLLRFDRIRDVVTPSFFDNLQGLRDATNQKLAYVFTSFRTLDELSPEAFSKVSLSAFAHVLYLPRAKKEDMQIIYETYQKRYRLPLAVELVPYLIELANGYVRYLHISLMILHEQQSRITTKETLFTLLSHDERVHLQSEELWENLTEQEQLLLRKGVAGEKYTAEERGNGMYLWRVGFFEGTKKPEETKLFSPLFASYLLEREKENGEGERVAAHFSKKEHLLYQLLVSHLGKICERETIIQAVWPESEEVGVSDWAIDRLVARVRTKLLSQMSPYEIKTIRTRGYQLIERG